MLKDRKIDKDTSADLIVESSKDEVGEQQDASEIIVKSKGRQLYYTSTIFFLVANHHVGS
jgi:hypothetical protein